MLEYHNCGVYPTTYPLHETSLYFLYFFHNDNQFDLLLMVEH